MMIVDEVWCDVLQGGGDIMTTDISLVRTWNPDATLQQEIVDDYEYDGGNSSSRLFERSRIKALAGESPLDKYHLRNKEPITKIMCGYVR